MRRVLVELRKTRAYRWGKVSVSIAGAVVSIAELAALPDQARALGNWLAGVESWVPYAILYALLFGICLTLLLTEIWAAQDVASASRGGRARASLTLAEAEAPRKTAASSIRPGAQARPATSSGIRPGDRAAPSAPPARSARRGEDQLSHRLERQLNEAVRLRENIPIPAGISPLTRPETTRADVETWVRRTRRLLRDVDPELLDEFDHRPPRALVEALLPTTSLAPPYKAGLDRHIANLRGIISDLRLAGR